MTIRGMAGRKEKEKEREQTGRAPQNNARMFRSGVSLRPAIRGEIESGRFEKSRLDEFCGLLENGVFGERVTRQEVVAVTNMGEYAGVKKKPGGEEKEKDRMVIKGGADPRVYDTYAGVLAQQSLLTCLPYMIIIGKVIYSVNVVKAFQQIEDRHKHSLGVLGIRILAGLPELPVENPFPEKYDDDQWLELRRKAAVLILGAIHRLEKAHYGGRHTGNLFVFSLQFELQKDGSRGEDADHLHPTREKNKARPHRRLEEGGSDRFAGIDMEREGGKLYLSKKIYLKDIEAEKILQRAGGRKVTVDELMMEPPKEGEVDTSLTEEYGAACGILGWAASFFWKCRVFYDELQRFTHTPIHRHLRNAGLVISRMQQEKERIEIRPLLPEGRAVHFYSDASRKPKTKEIRKGTIEFWGDKTWSHEKGDEWNPVLFKTARSTKLYDHPYLAEMEALK
uniref:Uncharacterized protein n=1 Tax=Chromera velia CCMP2878 TaxID=1169474 RepID=A0A0G4HK80_9ALVE|eukprot:Cvel_28377.t1-p1 / transcript=Cvel_28377.t1 / gene=Cvel_28377 / organism=Chromera_velia_CCMP2878 / gene_product=hypothetical protein / transcript_product=hypothetical protein / location=Cvel_scaffold3702:4003-5490(+) / protein_length=450 / sequence_SO=supercontig / SO=protein_coding / is_pseudo=false